MASTKPPAANAPGGAQGPLVEELRSQAMAHLGAAPEPPPKRQRTTTLVPVMVNIDRDEGDIRENFLWHIGETGYDPRPVAMRLAADLQLPQAMVKTIEDEIGRCLKGFKSWKDLGGPKVVRLQLYVKRGELVFRDEIDWDAGDPRGAAAVMAYATEVCRDLGLDLGWHTAITQHLSELVHDVVEDLRKRPELVTLVPPPTSIWRGMPPASLPSASSSDPASLSSLPAAPSLALVAAAQSDDTGPLVLSSKPEQVSRRPLFRPRLEHYDPTFDLEAQRRACREARKHGHGHGHHQGHGHGHHHSHQRPQGDAHGVKVEPQAQAPSQAQGPGVIKPEPHADRPTGPPTDPHVAPRVKPEPQGGNPGPAPGPGGLGMAPGPAPGLPQQHPPQAAGEVHVKREPGLGPGQMQSQAPQAFGVQQQQGMAPGWPQQQQQQHPQFPG